MLFFDPSACSVGMNEQAPRGLPDNNYVFEDWKSIAIGQLINELIYYIERTHPCSITGGLPFSPAIARPVDIIARWSGIFSKLRGNQGYF
jgi:hypothetical protein